MEKNEDAKRIMKNMPSAEKEKVVAQDRQEVEESSKPALSQTFVSALSNFLPLAIGGLFEGSEGAASAYQGAQQGMDKMQARDINERKMSLAERQLGVQQALGEERIDLQREQLNDPLRLRRIENEEERINLAKQNYGLREQQTELMKLGESRRGEKQRIDLGLKPVEKFEAAPEVKAARGTITATKNADALIDRALENPMAAGALPTQLARLAGQVGVLTDRDVAVFGDAGSIANRLKQIASTMATGTLTKENADFMRDLAATMRNNAQQVISGEASRFSKQYGTVLNKDPEKLQEFLLSGEPGVKEVPKKEPKKLSRKEFLRQEAIRRGIIKE